MIGIRGAITVDKNTKEDILQATKLLLQEIVDENELILDDVVSIYFTATKDLTKVYPAVAAREIGLVYASLLCGQEMYVEGSMEMCLRVLVHVNKDICQKDAKHVYLREAKKLRPDLADNK